MLPLPSLLMWPTWQHVWWYKCSYVVPFDHKTLQYTSIWAGSLRSFMHVDVSVVFRNTCEKVLNLTTNNVMKWFRFYCTSINEWTGAIPKSDLRLPYTNEYGFVETKQNTETIHQYSAWVRWNWFMMCSPLISHNQSNHLYVFTICRYSWRLIQQVHVWLMITITPFNDYLNYKCSFYLYTVRGF